MVLLLQVPLEPQRMQSFLEPFSEPPHSACFQL